MASTGHVAESGRSFELKEGNVKVIGENNRPCEFGLLRVSEIPDSSSKHRYRSITTASPCPMPMQIAATAMPPPRRFSSCAA